MTTQTSRRRLHLVGGGAAACALVLAACSGGGAAGGGGGAGVDFGASMEEYQAAFADVDPITLRIQGDGPEGSLANGGRQAYTDAVEEWSEGKITFEWGYSNSFVPDATEWSDGLADGRLDVGFFAPYYNPEVFPLFNDVTDATFLEGNQSRSTLISVAWTTDVTYGDSAYAEEASTGGIQVLAGLPAFSVPAIFCADERTSLSDLNGLSVTASGEGRVTQLTALGMTPVSMAFTELYEGLQRGVVDCASTVPSAIDTAGVTDMVPHVLVDPEASLVGFPIFIAVGENTWNSLPLVAQQLLFDRLDVFFEEELNARSERHVSWFEQVVAAGGAVRPFAADARERLLQTNDELLDSLDAAGGDPQIYVDAVDHWAGVFDEIYPDIPAELDRFLDEGGYQEVDTQPFVDVMFDDILLEHRPGG